MKISELEPNQGNINLDLEVIEIEEPRTFNKFGRDGQVANAKVKDDSGEIKLTLWNEQTSLLKPGMKIRLDNGYVKEWQGELQLSTGKFGKIEIIENI